MIDATFLIIALFGFIAVGEFTFLIMITGKFPWVLKCLSAKNLLLIIDDDGTLSPTPAKKDGYFLKTKKQGMFEVKQEDIVICSKLPTAIIYKPILRAANPEKTAVFGKLKKYGIDGKISYYEIINAEELSFEEFNKRFQVVEQ